MLCMLPDVLEWPIAVDNWESNYGKVLFSIFTLQMSSKHISFSHFLFCLCSSGNAWRLEDVIAKLNEKYGTHLLVNFFVGTDDRDSNAHIIHVGLRLLLEHPLPAVFLVHRPASMHPLTTYPPSWKTDLANLFKSDFFDSLTSRQALASCPEITILAWDPTQR